MAEGRTAQQEVAPKLAELSANVLFGDVWERPELSKRDRSMITVRRPDGTLSHRAVAGAHPPRSR